MFIELEHINGQTIYINVNHIVAVSPTSMGSKVHTVEEAEWEVNHIPKDLIETVEQLQGIYQMEEE